MANAPKVKRAMRHVADRVFAPYVERLSREIRSVQPDGPADAGARPGEHGVPTEFFHGTLHELRTIELERVPKGGKRAVSVGASGAWYFDWFEQAVGPLEMHVGVEAFEPEPADLPTNVRWVATTADRFEGIDDDDVDIVFAGQTSEHLWADELAGFLVQAHRVLRAGGVLVVDSPNRLVTQHLAWSHGGHTVELSADEFCELLALAGFATESVRGAWRCRFGDRVFQLEEGMDHAPRVVRRIVEGPEHVDDSFVWWLVARPTGAPDESALRRRTEELYDAHWPTRVCRGLWAGPPDDAITLAAGAAFSGSTLPFYLRAGVTRFGLRVIDGALSAIEGLRLDLVLPGGQLLRRMPVDDAERLDEHSIAWEVELDDLVFAVVAELHADAVHAPVRIAMPLDVRYRPTS